MFRHGLGIVVGVAVAASFASLRVEATEEILVEGEAWVQPAASRAELDKSMAAIAQAVKIAYAETLEAELRSIVAPSLKVASLEPNHRG